MILETLLKYIVFKNTQLHHTFNTMCKQYLHNYRSFLPVYQIIIKTENDLVLYLQPSTLTLITGCHSLTLEKKSLFIKNYRNYVCHQI